MNRLSMILVVLSLSPALRGAGHASAKNLVIGAKSIRATRASSTKQTTVVTCFWTGTKGKVSLSSPLNTFAITKAFADAALKRLEAIGKIQKAIFELSDEALKNNDFRESQYSAKGDEER